MFKFSALRNFIALAYMTALPVTLCTATAEARGVGVTHQSTVPTAAPAEQMAASPTDSPVMPLQAEDEIIAEHAHTQVPAEDAANLLNDLRLQLAAQPAAKLSIRWRLTRPAEIK